MSRRSGAGRERSGPTPSSERIAREIRRRRAGLVDGEPDAPPPAGLGPWLRAHAPAIAGVVLGVPAVGLLLLGTVGSTASSARAWSGTLALDVEFPARHRRGATDTLAVRVSNRSSRTMPLVSLRVDRAYLAAFADVAFTPPPDAAGALVLRDVRAGETREVRVRLTAADVGRHDGGVTATHGSTRLVAQVRTIVLP